MLDQGETNDYGDALMVDKRSSRNHFEQYQVFVAKMKT